MSNNKKKSGQGKKHPSSNAHKPNPSPAKKKSIVDTLTGPELKLALIDCLKKVIKVKETAPAKPHKKSNKIEIISPVNTGNVKDVSTPKPSHESQKPAAKPVDEFFVTPFKGASDEIPSVHDQEFHIGTRAKKSVSDSPLFLERFGYTHQVHNDGVPCDKLYDRNTGSLVGIIPRISVYAVWNKAHEWAKQTGNTTFDISRAQWDNACKKLVSLIGKNKETAQPMISNIMSLGELAFEELFLSKGSEVIKLIKAAIAYDIQETAYLKSKWKKIKKYIHSVDLHEKSGGIFTQAEVEILNSIGVYRLNDIRKLNIYTLKHHLLFRDMSTIVEEINAAFKEDLEKRKDKRFKVYPFVFGYPALTVTAILAYTYKYTLIKGASEYTPVINAMGAVWVLGIIVMIWGLLRGIRRRRTKNPSYIYYTKKVKRATVLLTMATLVIFSSSALYYNRYDGYNDTVYYRDINKNEVAIAGLREGKTPTLVIPDTMDGKKVTEIDWYAFKGDDMESVVLPDTVTKIDKKAFVDCKNLLKVVQYNHSVISVGEKAFSGCKSLIQADFLRSVETVSASAFEECSSLFAVDFDSITTMGNGAFKNCEELNNVSLGNKLETIPASAFAGCESLSDLLDYQSVTKISAKAFSGCTALGDIDFSSVVTIGEEAFKNCKSFRNIVVTSTTESIGKKAFGGCSNVLSITLPFIGKDLKSSEKQSISYVIDCNVEKMENKFDVILNGIDVVYGKSFNKCSAVKSIVLPDTVTEIKAGAFNSAKDLEYIRIPNKVTTLNNNLFKDCESLAIVEGCEGITVIGDGVFSGCASLTTLNFPNVETIGKSAFERCEKLASLNFGDELESIGDSAFWGCSSIEYLDISSCENLGKSLFANCGHLSSVELSSNVTAIPESFFVFCGSIVNFSVGSSVKEIGKDAFRSSGIMNIDLGSVESIGANAFNDCDQLMEIVIPDSVEYIGKTVFDDCANLYTVTSPFFGETPEKTKNGYKHMFGENTRVSTVNVTKSETIGTTTFAEGKDKIWKVNLGEGVVEIAKDAFKGFTSLNYVGFPTTIEKIGEGAFSGSVIGSADFSGTKLSSIGKKAFSLCQQLGEVKLSAAIKLIPESAFDYCSSLREIDLYNVTTIEAFGFRESGLERLVIPDGVKEIGEGAFYDCSNMISVEIGSGLRTIEKETFANCINLNYIFVPGTVKTIGESAFSGCSRMLEIYLSVGIEKIGNNAFADCRNIEIAEIPTTVTSMGKNIFIGCDCLVEISVPFIGSSVDKASKMTYITDSKVIRVIEITKATTIAAEAFTSCARLEILRLNEGIISIGDGVVDGCNYLSELDLPKTATKFKHLFPSYLFAADEESDLDASEDR